MNSTLQLLLEVATKAFDAEMQRSERLTGKAEKYLGAVAVVIGFGLIRIDGLFRAGTQFRETLASWLAGASD